MKVRVQDVVLDEAIYPRTQLFDQHAEELKDSLKAGAKLPPIILEKDTLRLVDGAHRLEAHRRLNGDQSLIEAEMRVYATEADILMEAARLNSTHGKRLSSYDIVRVAMRAEALGVDPSLLARNLQITPEKLSGLSTFKVAYRPTGEPLTVRRSLSHLAGQTLTPEQEVGAGKAGGQVQVYYVNQVLDMLRYNLIEETNPRLLAALAELRERLVGLELQLPASTN